MIRRLRFEIVPYPLMAGEQNMDDDRHRRVEVNVTTERNSYSFTEIIPVDEWEGLFEHIMRYAAVRLKEIIKQDEVSHGKTLPTR